MEEDDISRAPPIVASPSILNREDTCMHSIAQSPYVDKNEGGGEDTCGQVLASYFCDCFYFICRG